MFWLITVICVFLCLIWADVKKPHGYPPGPAWLPVVGNYLWFQQQKKKLGYYHLVWDSLRAKYGPVVGARLGRTRVVVVSGYEAARNILLSDEFEGRPDGFFFRLRTFGKQLGVVFAEGHLWHEQRRFCLQHLRKQGLGKQSMQAQIEAEAGDLVTRLRDKSNGGSTPLKLHDAFDVCVLNSLWAMLAGERFALDDRRMMELIDIVHNSFRVIDTCGGLLNQMPFLRFIAPGWSGYTRLLSVLNRLWGFLRETIDEHRKTLSPGCTKDFIDSYLEEMEVRKNETDSTFNDMQLVSLCLDLFMAGSETTSSTLGFAVLYMLHHPEVQRRVHDELDGVVGRSNQPTLQHRPRLCYVESVIMEVQRHVNIAPLGIAHRALKDTRVMGHFVPEGATVMVSIWSVHMDHKHWGDPEVFRPERFLDGKGGIVHDDWFMPFGFGKRRCLGEILGKSGLFLFFSTLLHNFSISVPPGHPLPSLDGRDGLALSPKPFYASLVPRT